MERFRNIIFFHAGALGDLVNTLPALVALRARFPEAAITGVGNAGWLSLFQAAGVIDHAVSLERPGLHQLFAESVGAGLRPARVDGSTIMEDFAPGGSETRPYERRDDNRPCNISPDLRAWLSAFDLAISWVRRPELSANLRRIGLTTISAQDPFPPPPGAGHVTDYLARPLAQLGIDVGSPDVGETLVSTSEVRVPLKAGSGAITSPRLSLPPSLLSSGPRFLGLLIHPGSGSPRKNFPPDLFAQAAALIAEKTGLPLAILQGPADAEAADALFKLLRDTHSAPESMRESSLPTRYSLPVTRFSSGASDISRDTSNPLALASLLASARLLLANDSGVAHLAGALGAPVIALFKSSDPSIWSVRQPHAVNLTNPDPALILHHALSLLKKKWGPSPQTRNPKLET